MKFTRARDYRLYYGNPGRRILDIELDGGRCLLGHNPKGLGNVYKNTISRGIFTGVETSAHRKLLAALNKKFSSHSPLIFPNRDCALKFTAPIFEEEVDDDIFNCFSPRIVGDVANLSLFRPFSGMSPAEDDIVFPILPQPGYISPQIVLLPRHLAESLPAPGALSSPVMLRGTLHILSLLNQAEELGSLASVARLRHQPAAHRNQMGITQNWYAEDSWKRFSLPPTDLVTRSGPYIYPANASALAAAKNIPAGVWSEFAADMLKEGLKIPAKAWHSSILPARASRGEISSVASYLLRYTEYITKFAGDENE